MCFRKCHGTLLLRGQLLIPSKVSFTAIFWLIQSEFHRQSAGVVDESGNSQFPCDSIQPNIIMDSCISLAFFSFYLFIMVCNEFSDVSFGFEAGIMSSGHKRKVLFQSGHSCWLAPILACCQCFGCLSYFCFLSLNFLKVFWV